VRIAALLALTVMTARAAYVLEWSAPADYSSATAYSSNKTTGYDVNGDSIPDVFLSDSSALKVYSGVTHSLIWTIPSGGGTYTGVPYIANTDGDAAQELVFYVYTYDSGWTARFYVYDCGTHALEYTSPVKNGFPYVAVADVDGDNKSEIIITSGNAGSRVLEVYGSDDANIDEGKTPAPTGHGMSAYPNPSTSAVTITLPVSEPGATLVTITDIGGRLVRRLERPAQAPVLTWDCSDDAETPVPAGIYIYHCGALSGKLQVAR
jgi:hypothetical protein